MRLAIYGILAGMAGRISTAAPLKWAESPRSHKPFLGDLAGGDAAAGAAPILDDDLLPERLAHLFRGGARHDVVAAASSASPTPSG
jgi:hypothetical protein